MILVSLQAFGSENTVKFQYLSHKALNYSYINNNSAAERTITDAMKNESNYWSTWLARARIFYRSNNYVEAINSSEELLKRKPDCEEGWLIKAESSYRNNNISAALDTYNMTIILNPKCEEAYNNRGWIFQNKGSYEYAAYDFEKATSINPMFFRAWSNLGYNYYKQNKFSEAFEIISKIPEMNRDDLAKTTLGQIYFDSNDYEDAKVELEKVNKDYNAPDNYNASKLLAQTYLQLNDHTEAKDILGQLIKTNDRNKRHDTDLNVMLGQAYLNSSQPNNATIEAQNAISMNKNNSDAYIILGKSYLDSKKPVFLAQKEFERAIKITPKNRVAWEGLSQAYSRSGHFQEAIISAAIARNINNNTINAQAPWVIILITIAVVFLFIITFKKRIPIELTLIIGNLLGLLLIGWIVSSLLKREEFSLFWSFWVILLIISGGLIVFLGKSTNPWSIRVAWAVLGYGSKFKGYKYMDRIIYFLFIFYSILLIIFLYIWRLSTFNSNPLGSNYDLGSINNILSFIKFSLISAVVISSIITIPPVVNLLKSRNIDQDTRDIVAVTFFSFLCVILLYSSIALWFFKKVGENRITIPGPSYLSQTPFSLSMSSVYLAFIAFIFLFIYPYLNGVQNGKNWRKSLQDKKDDHINKLLYILEYQKSNSLISSLDLFSNEINKEYVDFGASNDMNICSESAIEESTYCSDIKRIDPSINYLKFLDKIGIRIKYCLADLKDEKNSDDESAIVAKYSDKCKSKKKEINEYTVQLEQTKPQLLVYAAALLGPIIVAIYDNVVNQITVNAPTISNLILNFTLSGAGNRALLP
jgi:tetratricopeptide (TPR) repeat protein